jgi:hypothetical protein
VVVGRSSGEADAGRSNVGSVVDDEKDGISMSVTANGEDGCDDDAEDGIEL